MATGMPGIVVSVNENSVKPGPEVLIDAIRTGDIDLLVMMLKQKSININNPNLHDNMTAYMYARKVFLRNKTEDTKQKSLIVIGILLDAGAKIDVASNSANENIFTSAIHYQFDHLAVKMLNAGFELDFLAATNTFKYLMKHQIDILRKPVIAQFMKFIERRDLNCNDLIILYKLASRYAITELDSTVFSILNRIIEQIFSNLDQAGLSCLENIYSSSNVDSELRKKIKSEIDKYMSTVGIRLKGPLIKNGIYKRLLNLKGGRRSTLRAKGGRTRKQHLG